MTVSADYVLPLRPAPIDGESLLGYLQRLAAVHRCEHVHWITELAGIEPRQLSVGQADLTPLARMCRLDRDLLDRMRSRELDEGCVIFLGHRLPREFIRNRYQRVCGPCLAEAGYHRLIWDLAFLGACSRHKARLIDSCKGCGQFLRWNRPSVTHCDCGAILVQQTGSEIAEEDAEAISTIVRRFQADADSGAEPNCPGDLSPGDYVELILFLGRNSLYVETGIPQQGRTLDRPDLFQILRSGLDIAEQWPRQFHELLDRVQSKRPRISPTASLTVRFGQIYRTIARLDSSGWGGVVREGFREYLRINSSIPILASSPLVEGLVRNPDYIDVEEASRILELTPGTLRRILRSPAGREFRSTARDMRGLLHKADVEAFGKKLSDTINLAELRERLGVGNRTTVRMVSRSNIFAMRERMDVGGERSAAVVASDVDAFFSQLDESASRQISADGANSFTEIWNLAGKNGFDLPGLLLLIKHGKIEAVGVDARGGEGLNRYLFDGEAVKDVLLFELEQKTGTVSALIAAERLGIKLQIVYDLAGAGILESRKMQNPKGLRITSSSIEQFGKNFTTSAIMARELGAHSRVVDKTLKRLDVAPAVEVPSGTGVIRIYRRSSIDHRTLEDFLES